MILFVLVSGCSHSITKETGQIIAVWKHEPNVYSVTIKEGKNTLIDKDFRRHSAVYPKYSLIDDVSENSNMWYEATYDDGFCETVVIHVRSINDINNAGWNHGKFGSGSTERVQ